MSSAPLTETGGDRVLAVLKILWSMDHSLQVVSKRMSRDIGVTGPQRFVLKAIARQSGVTPGELAENLHLDKSTLTGVLQRLLQRRLIARRTDPADARRARLDLTEKGAALTRVRSGTVEAAVQNAIKAVPPETVAGAEAFLLALIAEMSP